jgi:hypothetical protein
MKANLVAVITLGAAVLLQTGWTKTKADQTKAERIKEIDAQLANWASMGRPQNANRRVALKAANFGYATSAVTPVSASVAAPVNAGPTPMVAQNPTSTENRWEPMAGDSGVSRYEYAPCFKTAA